MKKQTLNICVFNRHAYNILANIPGPVGGAERAMSNLAKLWAKKPQTNVTLITQANALDAPVMIDNIRILPLHHHKRPLFGYNKRPDQLLKFLWDEYRAIIKARPDVICVSQATIETMVVYMAARKLRVPMIYRIASNMELDHNILLHEMLFGRVWLAYFFENILRRSAVVVAQTQEQAAIIKKRFNRNVPIIGNMLTTPLLDLTAAPKKNTILWVGRAHPMKRLEVFIDLAQLLPQHHFVAIAPLVPSKEAYMDAIQKKAQNVPNLRLIPGLLPDEVQEEYKKARISVMTSETEGFPNVMAESMANGAPFLTTLLNPAGWLTNLSGVRDIDNALPACGYRCGDDLSVITAMITRMMTDDTFRHACAVKAQTIVKDNMDPQLIADRYYQLFEEVSRQQVFDE